MRYNKKSQVMMGILITIGVIIFAYIIIAVMSFIFPKFAELKASLDYFLMIGIFLIVQVLFLGGYYLLGKYVVTGFFKFKDTLMKVSLNFEKYLIRKKISQ